jgi:hypothetical protein
MFRFLRKGGTIRNRVSANIVDVSQPAQSERSFQDHVQESKSTYIHRNLEYL